VRSDWQCPDGAGPISRFISDVFRKEYTPLLGNIQYGTSRTEILSSTTYFGYSERLDTGLQRVPGISLVSTIRTPGTASLQVNSAEKMVGDTGIEPVTLAIIGQESACQSALEGAWGV
jgi:hypothetical protein